MSSKGFISIKPWFTSKKKLIEESKALAKQLEETKANSDLLEKSLEEWKKKSDIMDLLGGDERSFKQLAEYGSLDSILKRVEDYEGLQNRFKLIEKKNRRLENLLEEKE